MRDRMTPACPLSIRLSPFVWEMTSRYGAGDRPLEAQMKQYLLSVYQP
jgi:hypothetical protein